jgi:predicted CXXCH cytochrome family protein
MEVKRKALPPLLPPTPSNFTVLSGNLKDILSWEKIEGATYRVYKATSLTGPFTLTTETEVNMYVEEIEESEVGYRYYKVSAVKEGMESTPTEAELNEKVFVEERIFPEKETTIVSSNGELLLTLPLEAVSEEVTITIEEKGLPHDTPNYTDTFLTSSYDFQPEGLSFSFKPSLSLKYIPPVSEESFEKDWLSKTAKLFYYDESVGVWLDVSDSLSVDTTENLITSKVSHFSSYAGGYTVMPHGRYSDASNLCDVCHDAHSSQGDNLARRENVDLCYYCHGAPTSTLPPSGAHGENVQAEFVDTVDQSYSGTQTITTQTNVWSQTTQAEFDTNTFNQTVTTNTAGGEVILDTTGGAVTLFSDGFESGDFSNWDFSDWGIDSNASNAHSGSYSAVMNNTNDEILRKTVDTAGRSNVKITFWLKGTANTESSDYVRLQVYNTSTSNWDTLWSKTLEDRNTNYEQVGPVSVPSSYYSSNMQFQILAYVSASNEYQHVDDVEVYDDLPVEYVTSGTVTSVEIVPSGNLYSWDTLSWSETLNGGDITIDVLGYNGSSWDTLKTGLTNPSGESLSDIDVSTYTRLKLVAHLTRGSPTSTPYLNSWQVSYTTYYTETPSDSRHPVPEREVVCADCHTPHRDPDDYPKLLFEWDPTMGPDRRSARKYYKDEPLDGGESSNPRYVGNSTIGNRFCWGCHGTWENTFINNPTYYSESGGDHKTGYEQSAHWTGLPTSSWVPSATYDSTCNITDTSSTAINCLNCHLEHGSNASNRLTGYRGTPKKEEELCYSCHPTQQSEFQSAYHHAVDEEWGGAQGAAKVECTSCHNPHLVRDPDVTPDYMITNPDNTKNIWQINAANNYRTGFCLTCHDSSPPEATISTSTIVPYTILFPNTSQYPGFPGWNKSDYLTSQHWSSLPYPEKECTNCHSQHGTNYYRMLKAAEDDGTNPGNCLYDANGNSCHVSGNSYGAPDIKTPLQRTFNHPVLTYSGRHSDTETTSDFGSNRHAECVDCHNPHMAQAGTHTAGTSTVSNALKGTWGVEPPNTPAWQVPDQNSYTIVKPAQYEYQICFKCHSSYAFGSNPPSGLTDQAKEFNPNNASYHGVMAVPTDTYSGASYDSPWTYNSRMYCSDCHGSDQSGDAEGPHGSNRDHILKGRWDNTMTYDSGYTGSLCDRCHNIGSATGFRGSGGMNSNLHTRRHNRRACINCHSRIPHGMNNNHLWVFGKDPAPYKDSNFGGATNPWPHKTPGNWSESDCHNSSVNIISCD